MMEKMWKTILITCFIALISVTTSGMTTLADDAEQYEEEAITVLTEMSERDTVGTNEITVGDGVTATFDSETGAIEFYSNGGTLWRDWVWKSGINVLSIKSIKVASGIVYLPEDSSAIFRVGFYDDYESIMYTNLEELELSGFDTSNVTNMGGMFRDCSKLTHLDLSHFNTSKVTNMYGMFENCSSLTELDLSSFDTFNVTNMSFMFNKCRKLTSLDVSSFDTSNVTDMQCMFLYCESIENLDLSNFVTSKVTSIVTMFYGCENLTSLDVSSFDTSNVDYMSTMFTGCTNLASLDLSNFNTTNVFSMEGMFNGCSHLSNLDLSSFDTSNVTRMNSMFNGCSHLSNLDLSNFSTSNVVQMDYMFQNCSSLTNLDLSNFDTSNVTGMRSLFGGCNSLVNLDLSNFDTSKVTDMTYLFGDCMNLISLNLSFNTAKVTDMRYMFSGCKKLESLDLSDFDTSSVTDMYGMFSGCSSLTSLDLGSFNTSNVANMEWMFYACESLTNLNLSSFDMSSVTNKEIMFTNCNGLEVLRTPKMNSITGIALPHTLYDRQGITYDSLPVLSKSIVLGITKEIAEENSKIDVSTCTVTLNQTEYTYDGKAKEPVVTARDGKQVLSAGTDYTVTYSDNRNAGVATVTVTATDIGNCKGTTTVYFTINKAEAGLSYAKSSLTKQTTDAAFTNALSKATDEVATFASSNTKVAEVDSVSGLVTIKGAGTATITAVTSEGKNYKAGSTSYILTVEAPTPIPSPTVSGFSDVQDLSHPYYNAIYWAAEAGITKGYSDGTFGVNRSCTRGEMMMFLWRYAGKPSPKAVSKSPFKDVPMNHVFYKAILWGSQKGITKGYPDGSFGINKNVSRGECMMFLWRLKGKPSPKTVSKSPFKDVLMSQAFYKAILWGSQKGVTKGYTSGPKKGNFGINDNCTRGQIVTFLYRL